MKGITREVIHRIAAYTWQADRFSEPVHVLSLLRIDCRDATIKYSGQSLQFLHDVVITIPILRMKL